MKLSTPNNKTKGNKTDSERFKGETECASDIENILEWARLTVSSIRHHAASVEKYREKLKARGETDQRLREFEHWRESTVFTEREKAALHLSELMSLHRSEELSSSVLNETKRYLSREERVRLTLNIMAVNDGITARAGIPGRVLVVEDNPSEREFLRLQLQKDRMADNVIFVPDAVQAMAVLEDFQTGRHEGKLIALFLEFRLPVISGIELLRQIRAMPKMADLPVIVMTVSSDPKDIEECKRLRVASYVEKPITFGSFSKAVANVFHPVKAA